MTEYEKRIQQRERRNNAARLSYALYAAIGGAWCTGTERPKVQRLATMLNYMPEQLVEDIKSLESYIREKTSEDAERYENDD